MHLSLRWVSRLAGHMHAYEQTTNFDVQLYSSI